MKKIILLLTLLSLSFAMQSQSILGGGVYLRIKNLAGTDGLVYRDGTGMKTSDSMARVYLNGTKLLLDTLRAILRTDSTNLVGIANNIVDIKSYMGNSQGTPSTGVKGPLILGKASTAAPTYTDNYMYPPSFDANGNMRVVIPSATIRGDVSGVKQPVAGGTTQNLSLDTLQQLRVTDSAATDFLNQISNNSYYLPDMETWEHYSFNKLDTLLDVIDNQIGSDLNAINSNTSNIPTLTANGEAPVTVQPASAYGTITTQNLSPTRTATANSAVVLDVRGRASIAVQVRGVYTGALSLQATLNDTVWMTVSALTTPIYFYRLGAINAGASISSADTGLFYVQNINFKSIRLTALSAVTGTATINIYASQANVLISGTSTVASASVSGTVNSSGNVAEDALASNGQNGVFIMAVRADTLTSALNTANGEYTQLSVTKAGEQLFKESRQHRATYRSSIFFTLAASPTDIFSIAGVASKTIMVTKIIVSGVQTTGGTVDVSCLKRSSVNTSGTVISGVPLDAGDAAAGSRPEYYTANPTPGSLVGTLEVQPVFFSATTAQPEKHVFDFGARGKPVTLTSASQLVVVNLGGVTVTGGKAYITVEWTENW